LKTKPNQQGGGKLQGRDYTIIIDRSGSMYNAIKLASEAVMIFLHSIPYGSYFNIVSYGSKFEMMFPTSV